MRAISVLTRKKTAVQATTSISSGEKEKKKSRPVSYIGKRLSPFPPKGLCSDFPFVPPEQFFAEPRYSLQRTGEYRLLVAVLQDALECWLRYRNSQRTRGQRLFREIDAWFFSYSRDQLFTFESICDYLALDPDAIRRSLMQWRTAQPSRVTPRFYLTPVVKGRTCIGYDNLRTTQRGTRVTKNKTARNQV